MFSNLNYELSEEERKENINKEIVGKFFIDPINNLKDFEVYMVRVMQKKLNLNEDCAKLSLICMLESRYPKAKGACEIIYDHFMGYETLSIEENAKYLIDAITLIENI